MFRSALLILSGNAATALMLLARNLLIARLIPVTDYGIAATFAIAMAVVEMASQLGLQQQIVQAKDGEKERFQAALQGFQLLRGCIAGGVLFLCAGPIANFLNVPDVKWAYQVMAVVPVLMALTHFDIHRLNRTMVFWPVIISTAVPALVSVLAVFPLALFYGDYRVMLWAIVIRAVMIALTSQLVAQRRYRLVLDRAIMGQSLRFGWPLLVNGALLFAVFQGDKLIVGRELGMATLAVFAMGFTLTLTPTLVVGRSAQNFFLPQLSKIERDTPEGEARFQTLSMVTIQAIMLMALLLIVAIDLLGGVVVTVLVGPKYEVLIPFLVWLAVMQALRVSKSASGLVALSQGHTTNAMMSNVMRVLVLPLAWYIAVTTGDLLMIIWIGIAGEIAGYLVSLLLLRRQSKVALQALTGPHIVAVVTLLAAMFVAKMALFVPYGAWGWLAHTALYAVLLGVFFWSCRDLRRYVKRRKSKTDV